MRPRIVTTASTVATRTIQNSVYRISRRRSTMSPMAPAGSAKTKNGRADAVCVSATYIGPAPSETMSHAAPTVCMNVPISDMTSAIRRLRKTGVRSGRHRLGVPLPSGADSVESTRGRVIRTYAQPPHVTISETVDQVIVHHADRLHVRVDHGGSDEAEAAPLEGLAELVGLVRRGWDLAQRRQPV